MFRPSESTKMRKKNIPTLQRHSLIRIFSSLLMLGFAFELFYMNARHLKHVSELINKDDQKRPSVNLTGLHPAFTSCNTTVIDCQTYNNIEEVHDRNRCILNNVDQWASSSDLKGGVFHYGLPQEVEHKVTEDVGERINLSDMVSYLLTQFGTNSNYMEMGVSVCKTLFQVLTTNCHANIVAFDIERINPTFENIIMKPVLIRSKEEEVLTGHEYHSSSYNSPKKDNCTLNTYDQGILRDNHFYYLNCDEFDQVGWNRMEQLVSTLPKQSYQVIFSDALHSQEAINFELDHIFKHNLLNKYHFAYVWDDMGDYVAPFCDRIVDYASLTVRNNITCVIGSLPGWFGINEYDHTIAIITTLDISNIISKHMGNPRIIREPNSM
jgi:uncharacterized protein (UPF0212 family)